MKALFAVVIALIMAFVVTAEVVKLNEGNYDAIVGGDKPAFVKYFAPWCGHCVRMQPAWEELSRDVTDVVIAEVDATQEQGLASKAGVRGYPTIKFFKAGSKDGIAYQGARTVDALKTFINANK